MEQNLVNPNVLTVLRYQFSLVAWKWLPCKRSTTLGFNARSALPQSPVLQLFFWFKVMSSCGREARYLCDLLCGIGELGPVGDIHMSGYTRDSLLVSWTPPFSLDISHSIPDLWYSLSLATPPGTSLPCSNCHYITESFYNLSLTSVSQGMYEISVVPSNAYGRTNHASRLFVYIVLEYDCNASTSNVTTNISLLVPGMG